MASMLRSGKFFRLFSNLTRSFDLNNGGRSNNEFLLGARRGEWETNIQRFVVFQLITGAHEIPVPTWLNNVIYTAKLYFLSRSLSAAQLPLKNLNDSAVQQPPISTINDSVDKAIEKAELDAKKSGRITKDDILDIIQKIKKQSIILFQHPTNCQNVKCLIYLCLSRNCFNYSEFAAHTVLWKSCAWRTANFKNKISWRSMENVWGIWCSTWH